MVTVVELPVSVKADCPYQRTCIDDPFFT